MKQIKIIKLESDFVTYKIPSLAEATCKFFMLEVTMAKAKYLTLQDIDNIVSQIIYNEQVIDLEHYRHGLCMALVDYIYNL